MTNTLILHHKSVSPYSKKIKLMLGHTATTWQSVHVPLTPPRPSIDPLINGYRRIPVLQIGADLFCDTRLIADEIAKRSQHNELSPFLLNSANSQQAEYIENYIFFVALQSIATLPVLKYLIKRIPLRELSSYLADKKLLMSHLNPDKTSISPNRKQSKLLWQNYLDELEAQLSDSFLTGNTPNYVDFCAVHMIWYRMDMEGKVLFKQRPKLQAWYQRMMNFSHGQHKEISSQDSLQIAAQASPAIIDNSMQHSPLIGKRVTISTTDILLGETQGILVGEDDNRWIIARKTEVAGTVHIHFPKQTYQLTPN